jgi:hypothetical protein
MDLPASNTDGAVEITDDELHLAGEIVEMQKVGWLRHRTRRVGQFDYATVPGHSDADQISADLATACPPSARRTAGSPHRTIRPRHGEGRPNGQWSCSAPRPPTGCL